MVTIINTMLIKPGEMDPFIASQRNFVLSMSGRLPGLVGGRMYRNADASKAVLVSQFDSAEAQAAIMKSAEFRGHLAKLGQMVETSSPDAYAEAYTYGGFK